MSDKVVRLRHAVRKGDWMMYFYEGELPVVDSVITIPEDRPEWIRRAWIQGFRLTEKGRVVADLDKHIRSETTAEASAVEHKDLGEDFVHTDSDTCDCLTLTECCSDECCQPEDEEAALRCCGDDDDCCNDDDGKDCACAVTPAAKAETAKSGEETDDEGSDAGRQPADEDGVRTRQPARRKRTTRRRVRSSKRDEHADGGSGD